MARQEYDASGDDIMLRMVYEQNDKTNTYDRQNTYHFIINESGEALRRQSQVGDNANIIMNNNRHGSDDIYDFGGNVGMTKERISDVNNPNNYCGKSGCVPTPL